jgi:ribonuclease HI
MSLWKLSCDGTALPNPGRIGVGALLVGPDGARHTVSRDTGLRGCNNEAEARALIAGLQAAAQLGARIVAITCDSDVVVQQVAGAARTRIPRLALLFAEARALLGQFARAELRLVPRARNAEADALARGAFGLPPKVRKRRRSRG